MKLFVLMLKNLRRNLLRTTLTVLALFVLVLIVTVIWSFLHLMDSFTEKKAGEQKAIVTERWQFPSMMPWRYAYDIQKALEQLPPEYRPTDYMTWQFYGGTIDPKNRTQEAALFMFAMDPRKLNMMDEMQDLDPALVKALIDNPRGLLVGRDRLRSLNKRIGDKITVTSFNYKGIDLEFDLLGLLPDARYSKSAIMNSDYLLKSLDEWKANPKKGNGTPHMMAEKTLSLFWFQAKDLKSIQKAAELLEKSPDFTNPAIKCETASSGIASFIEPYRDLLWGMRWILTPIILAVMALVIANAISITVRERRTEMAVMKVLGFRPGQLLVLVLGEVVLVGALTGLICTSVLYFLVNRGGGVQFPVAFFPAFTIPAAALWWGPAIGAGTAIVGSFLPAWSARSIKVSEVFSKVG